MRTRIKHEGLIRFIAFLFVLIPFLDAYGATTTVYDYDDANRVVRVRTGSGGDPVITATAGAHGSISSPGASVVGFDTNKTYTITANAGYQITNVIVDGVSRGAISSYTFSDVTANHTIEAFFEVAYYIITATATGDGTISPLGLAGVVYGGSKSYTITPDTGHLISDVKVDGISQGPISSYQFTNVTSHRTIEAFFTTTNYTPADYATLQEVYWAAPAGSTIRVKAGTLEQNLHIYRDVPMTIVGGYNDDFTAVTGTTRLNGSVWTWEGGGTVTFSNFEINDPSYVPPPAAPVTTLFPSDPTAQWTYHVPQLVTLHCSDGSGPGCDKIYYTLDGITPTTASPVYSSPINIGTTTTIKFFATDLLGHVEAVKTRTITITPIMVIDVVVENGEGTFPGDSTRRSRPPTMPQPTEAPSWSKRTS